MFVVLFGFSSFIGMSQVQQNMANTTANDQQEEIVIGGGVMLVKTMNLSITGMDTQADVDGIHQMLSQNYQIHIRQMRTSVTTGLSSIQFVGTEVTKNAMIASIQNLGYQVIVQ